MYAPTLFEKHQQNISFHYFGDDKIYWCLKFKLQNKKKVENKIEDKFENKNDKNEKIENKIENEN